jgi:hypothetical protein
VGDFSAPDTHASLGYAQIKADIESCKCGTASFMTRRSSDVLNRLTPERADRLRGKACHPIPIPVDENGARQFLSQNAITTLFSQCEVVCVISAGQTTTTLRLLEALHPYNTPICVTVASVDNLHVRTIGSGQESVPYTNLLRLNPSNDQQGQALVARVRSLLDVGIPRSKDVHAEGTPKDFTLLTSDQSNEYCRDLARAIRRHSILAHPKLTFNDLQTSGFDQVPKEGIVVYVGYADQLRNFPAQWGVYRGIITSDGFPEDRVRAHINKTPGDRTRFFVCQSSVPPPTLIQQAYEAIRSAWRGTQSRRQARQRTPSSPLLEFVDLVKQQLQTGAGEGAHYHFLGHQNARSAYFVRRLG